MYIALLCRLGFAFFICKTFEGLIGAIEKIGEACIVHLTESSLHLSVHESGSEGVDVYAELQQVHSSDSVSAPIDISLPTAESRRGKASVCRGLV